MDVVDAVVVIAISAAILRVVASSRTTGAAALMLALYGLYSLARENELVLASQVIPVIAAAVGFGWLLATQRELVGGYRRVLDGPFVLFTGRRGAKDRIAASVARAAAMVVERGHGATFVLERDDGLNDVAETGMRFDARLTPELLATIFIHDLPVGYYADASRGATIIRGEQLIAVGVDLPPTELNLSARFGARHRAALGLTGQTDAIVVVVSDDSQGISVVERARIVRNLDVAQLERILAALLVANP